MADPNAVRAFFIISSVIGLAISFLNVGVLFALATKPRPAKELSNAEIDRIARRMLDVVEGRYPDIESRERYNTQLPRPSGTGGA